MVVSDDDVHSGAVPDAIRRDVETLWQYHDMHHELRPCDVGLGLGSHDMGVAVVATELFHRGLFPLVLFTGANAPTTVERFPRGEAVHYREYAVAHGVPPDAVLVETRATNTAENFTFAQRILRDRGIAVGSLLVMSRPYQQRRAFATCRKVWPDVEIVCASNPLSLDDYVATIGDAKRVIDMLVGDTQRIDVYAERGFAIPQQMPDDVGSALARLIDAGYRSRLV